MAGENRINPALIN